MPEPKKNREDYLEDKIPQEGIDERVAERISSSDTTDGTIARRTSSRLRRTNDRSVRVISGDAEDASHVNGSYPSKQKYKLDLSSLHEDHEDNENAEIGVRQQCLDAIYDPTPKDITEHLEEIRNRLFLILGLGALIFIICFNYSEFLISLLEKQAPEGSSFFQLKPGELLFSSFKASGFASLILISPIICQQVLAFTRPGLKAKEYRVLKIIFLSIPLLLMSGISFAYYFILPPLLNFLLGFNSTVIESRYGIEHFINLCLSLLMISGISFQIPILIVVLNFFKLVTIKQLLSIWRYVTVGAFVLSAFLTPTPDPFTMSILAFAILGLYFSTVLIVKVFKI
ncbi:MAG: twin-arginine translocase subunit TatC [bacterium]